MAALLLAAAASAHAGRLAVDGAGRAYLVHAQASSAQLRVAAPGRAFGPWRTLMRARPGERVVDAAVAGDGSGVAVVQRDRTVRIVTLTGRSVGSSGAGSADFAATAVAPGGAAVVVWFRHHRDKRWRLEAAVRAPGASAFGRAQPLSRFVRRACCTNVSAAVGARGDAVVAWRSTGRPSAWAAQRRSGRGFRRAQRLTADAATAPEATVGADGIAAVVYSTQHVPLRAADGLQLHRAPADRFGRAEHVNPGGGVTLADVAIAGNGAIAVAWLDRVHGDRVHLSEAPAGGALAVTAELGTAVSPRAVAVDADATGRAVVAWTERAGAGERATAALRPAAGAPFAAAAKLGRIDWRNAEPGQAALVPGGGALVLWSGERTTARRTTLAVARLQ
jgi:hypothetical protein